MGSFINLLKIEGSILHLPRKRLINNLHGRRLIHNGENSIPRHSQFVICGGGVVGASVAYHLAARGLTDILLLEQGRLSCGTTWHAAGLVGSMRKGVHHELTAYSRYLYKWMEENNYPTSFKQCGSVNIASSPDRLQDMRRIADSCRAKKLEVIELSPKEVLEKCPWINVGDIQAGFWVPEDGVASPSDVCASLTKMAKEKGVHVLENCRVEKVITSSTCRVKAVETSAGIVQCNNVILCGGMWSRDLAAKTTPPVHVPVQPTEHFYLVTKPISGIHPMTPVIRDADALTYAREWSGGFLVGIFESQSIPVFPNGPPQDFQFQLFNENWDHFQKHFDPIFKRFPFLESSEIRLMTNGPESFTPDNVPLLGESPEVRGFYVAAGMNSSGISLAGGIGRTVAEIIIDGSPSIDCSELDIKRGFPHQSSRDFLWNRGHEIVGKIYKLNYPKQSQYSTGRCIHMSPLYGHHKWRGAIFGAVNDFEVPLWYPKCHQEEVNLQGTFQAPSWSSQAQEEIKESRAGLVVSDLTGLWGSITITGCGGTLNTLLDSLFYHDIRLPIGSLIQTGMLDNNGHYITEALLLSFANDRFQLIYPLETQTRVNHWLSHCLQGKNINVQDMTGDFAFLMLLGPKTNQTLRSMKTSLTHPGMFNVSTFGSSKETIVFQHPLLPTENAFACVPKKNALLTYEALLSEGARPMGFHALDTLRIEEGIAWWGHEVTSGETPLTAGKANEVLNQTKHFIGKTALIKGSGVQRCHFLIHFTVPNLCDGEGVNWLWGGEPILMGKSCIGTVSSVSLDSRSGSFVGLGHVAKCNLESKLDQLQVINGGKTYDINIVRLQ